MLKFPDDFLWGTATSSYQIEGAANLDGKGPSIWDEFTHSPGKTHQGETGDKACDHYHLYKSDVALMAQMGVKAYRFSISWPRVQPDGEGALNAAGMKFYSDLIDELIAHGIEPWVTLYHWDLPLALHKKFDGWLSKEIVHCFANYAALCFEHLGDRVKNWITLNEPWVVSILGYGQGVMAPGYKSSDKPYIAGHHQLLSHAKAVEIYREKYQPSQHGRIGISNNCDWREPKTDSQNDKEAAQRSLEFFLGWFADPIWLGDYPEVMKKRLGNRLPSFSESEKKSLLGSSDFFGLNHYTTLFAADVDESEDLDTNVYGNGGLFEDQYVKLTADPDWKLTSMKWAIVPWGCRKLLLWIKDRYDNPSVYITENGCSSDDHVVEGKVKDPHRIEFFQGYLSECHRAIEDGANLSGYFIWSFLDNFEWALGYEKRFGITHVDFETLKRTPKASSEWFAGVIADGGF